MKDVLCQYSKEQIGQRDFALYSAGARVIPHLTSKTYQVKLKGMKAMLVSFFAGSPQVVTARGPISALGPEIHAGMCWGMSGSTGQLGIHLVRSIVVTSVLVEHISTLSAYNIDSSPKEMELWSVEDCTKLLDLTYYPKELSTIQNLKFQKTKTISNTISFLGSNLRYKNPSSINVTALFHVPSQSSDKN
jgi:hypothetical protein